MGGHKRAFGENKKDYQNICIENRGSMSNVGVERITNKKNDFFRELRLSVFYLFFSATIKVTLCILVCHNM